MVGFRVYIFINFQAVQAVFSLTTSLDSTIGSSEEVMSLRTAPILQFPENIAPGSIESLLVEISPWSLAVLLSVRSSSTSITPFNLPSKSAFLQ